MRKTIVVLALSISGVVLLQAPAWAPNLYSLNQIGQQSAASADSSLQIAVVQGRGSCKSTTVTITFDWGEVRTTTADSNGRFTVGLTRVPSGHNPVELDDYKSYTCGTLAFSGAYSVPLLVFGLILLLAGVLLVVLSRRQGRPMARE